MAVDLEQLLSTYGVDFVSVEDGFLATKIGSGQEGDPEFPLGLFVWQAGDGREYVRLIVSPFVERPEDGYPAVLSDTVLLLNDDVPRAKFILDENEELALVLDLDAVETDSRSFGRALELLGAYSNHFYPRLASLVG